MTEYEVSWNPDAIICLAEIWSETMDKEAVNEAVSEIDARLKNNPQSGEELSEGLHKIDFPHSLLETRNRGALK